MGRMKQFYFDTIVDEGNEVYDELLKDFDIPLPSEKELKKVAKFVSKKYREEYEEITGRTMPTIETESETI